MPPIFSCLLLQSVSSGFGSDGTLIAAIIAAAASLLVQLFVFMRVRDLQTRDHNFQEELQNSIAEARNKFEATQNAAQQTFEEKQQNIHQDFESKMNHDLAIIEGAQAEREQHRQHELNEKLEQFKAELDLWRKAVPQIINRVQAIRGHLSRTCDDLRMLAFSSHAWDDQEMVEHSAVVLQNSAGLFTRPAPNTPDLPTELRPVFLAVRSAVARMFLAFHVVKNLRDSEVTRSEIKSSWEALVRARDEFFQQADQFERSAYKWDEHGIRHIFGGVTPSDSKGQTLALEQQEAIALLRPPLPLLA